MQVTPGIGLVVEAVEGALGDLLLDESSVLFLGAVAPNDAVRLGQIRDLSNPVVELSMHADLNPRNLRF
jgi:hypothetical protein